MSHFFCPHCREPLTENAAGLVCPAGHAFDRAKSGYVNLLSARGGGNHGDDRRMVRARSTFLNGGYYEPLARTLSDLLKSYAGKGFRLFDAGCGEGYYTAYIRRFLEEQQLSPEVFGVDISREALITAGKRDRALELAVASVYDLPVPDCSCDGVLSVFSPLCLTEFSRILVPDGLFLMAYPLERHLWQLKAAVYDEPYPNKPESDTLEGFTLLERRALRYEIELSDTESIESLFMMTPYYYKTSKKDQDKLSALKELRTQVEFGVCIYRKQG